MFPVEILVNQTPQSNGCYVTHILVQRLRMGCNIPDFLNRSSMTEARVPFSRSRVVFYLSSVTRVHWHRLQEGPLTYFQELAAASHRTLPPTFLLSLRSASVFSLLGSYLLRLPSVHSWFVFYFLALEHHPYCLLAWLSSSLVSGQVQGTPVCSAPYLRDAILFFSQICLLPLCHTLNQPLFDYLHIQRLETA